MAEIKGYDGAFYLGKLHSVNLASGEVVTVPDDATLDFGSDASFTVEAWLQVEDSASDDTLIAKAGATGDAGWGISLVSGKAVFGTYDDDDSDLVTSTASINTGDWVHIAAVRNVSGDKIVVSVNGESDADTTLTAGNLANSSDVVISMASAAVKVGMLRVFNTALTGTQLSDVYKGSFPAHSVNNLKVELVCEEGIGTSLFDSSGEGNTSTTDGGWSNSDTYVAVTSEALSLTSTTGTLAHTNVWNKNLTVTVAGTAKQIDADFALTPKGKLVFTSTPASDVALVTYHYYPMVLFAGGFHNWSIDATIDSVDKTDFRSAGWRATTGVLKGWTATTERYWVDAWTNDINGRQVIARFYDHESNTKYWTGWANITGVHPSTGVDTIVNESLDFSGTGQLGSENS